MSSSSTTTATRPVTRVTSCALAKELGATKLALNVIELPPGESVCPYHYESGEEEWIVVLTRLPTVRTPDRDREPGPRGVAFCPMAEAGAHKVTNRSNEPSRIFIWSNRSHPA